MYNSIGITSFQEAHMRYIVSTGLQIVLGFTRNNYHNGDSNEI